MTYPPVLDQLDEVNFPEGRTDCTRRANNSFLRGAWGNPWGFEFPMGRHQYRPRYPFSGAQIIFTTAGT